MIAALARLDSRLVTANEMLSGLWVTYFVGSTIEIPLSETMAMVFFSSAISSALLGT